MHHPLIIFWLLSFFKMNFLLDSQYQRRYSQKMRRKAIYGPDSQLNRLRALNGAGNGINGAGGILMTEYNPNYEFGGGSCSLQDLKEIPREQLRLVKWVLLLNVFKVEVELSYLHTLKGTHSGSIATLWYDSGVLWPRKNCPKSHATPLGFWLQTNMN